MIRVTRRRVLLAVLALFLAGVGYVAWTLAGLPPVKYYLRYGLDPYCEPTGAKETHEGVEFIEIGPGIFRMGSDYLAEGGDWLGRICEPLGLPWGKRPKPSDEMPVHWVEFRRGFWIAKTEITNAQYERFVKNRLRTRYSKGDEMPVIHVSWNDAKRYCEWLAERCSRRIRLPSEAEWECACRAGGDGEFTSGADDESIEEYAWCAGDQESGTRTVATKKPNRWGLHDLHGSVWEWCEDANHDSYDEAPADGSPWVDEGSKGRVCRGGCWHFPSRNCRSAVRNWAHPEYRIWTLGFRPAFISQDD